MKILLVYNELEPRMYWFVIHCIRNFSLNSTWNPSNSANVNPKPKSNLVWKKVNTYINRIVEKYFTSVIDIANSNRRICSYIANIVVFIAVFTSLIAISIASHSSIVTSLNLLLKNRVNPNQTRSEKNYRHLNPNRKGRIG